MQAPLHFYLSCMGNTGLLQATFQTDCVCVCVSLWCVRYAYNGNVRSFFFLVSSENTPDVSLCKRNDKIPHIISIRDKNKK